MFLPNLLMKKLIFGSVIFEVIEAAKGRLISQSFQSFGIKFLCFWQNTYIALVRSKYAKYLQMKK